MHILFDHGTPAPLAFLLKGHTVTRAKELGWDTLSNGDLLRAADEAGFDVFVTTDKNLKYQQNLKERNLAVVVLGNSAWPIVHRHAALVIVAIDSAAPGTYSEIEIPD
jgi:hypothetical protein